MTVQTTKSFDKQYRKLDVKLKQKFKLRISLFIDDPLDPSLRNHALKGKYSGYRSIDITGDIRALYATRGNTVYLFAFIGSHSQLYG